MYNVILGILKAYSMVQIFDNIQRMIARKKKNKKKINNNNKNKNRLEQRERKNEIKLYSTCIVLGLFVKHMHVLIIFKPLSFNNIFMDYII